MASKASSRLTLYIPVVVIIVGIVAAAYYQEQVAAFFSLRMWDKSAPTRTVAEFLTAIKAGDKAKADSLLGDKSFQSLEKDGKWQGYFLVSNAGILDFKIEDLVGEPIQPGAPEFTTIGTGSALVSANDRRGKAIPYRLEVRDGVWKITEIRGGTPRAGGGMAPPPGTRKAPQGQPKPAAPKGG